MLRKAQNSFWYGFVFLLPWQTAWIVREVFINGEKWQYATGLLYVSDIALLGALFLFIFQSDREVWRVISRDAIFRLLLALLVWSLLSALWAIRADLAFLSAWRIFLMLSAYVLLRFGGVSIRMTMLVFFASMAGQAVLGISQWMGQYVHPLSILGVAEHESWRAGTSVLKVENGRWLRMYGGFEHPNVFGGALTMAILFGIQFLSKERANMVRAFFLGSMALFSFAIVLTFSRSAWLSLFCGSIVLLFFSLVYRNRLIPFQRGIFARTAIAIGISVIAFSIAFFSLREATTSRFSESTLLREGSASDRTEYLSQAFVMIWEHPLLGVGGGNFTAVSMREFPEIGTFVGAFQPVHMVPILVLAELGVVGFLFFFFLFMLLFLRAFRSANVLSFAILSAFLPILFLDHYLWTSHFGVVFFGILLGIAALPLEEHKKQT